MMPYWDRYERDLIMSILNDSHNIMFHKPSDYRDEEEYRLVVYDPENKNEFIDIKKIIKGVIVGDRFPKVYYNTILELANKYDTDVIKLEYKDYILVPEYLKNIMGK